MTDQDSTSHAPALALFNHKKNITIRRGRIIWADETVSMTTGYHPAGWVLPGGQRTQIEAEAIEAALLIDQIDTRGYAEVEPVPELIGDSQ